MAKEKNYAQIAAEKMYRPGDKEDKRAKRPPRFLIYARNKKGKTTFGNSAGTRRTLILDPEFGTKEMKISSPHVWPVESWADIDEAYEFARHVNKCPFKGCEFGEGHPFSWVSVDGLTRMSNFGLKHVMKIQEDRSLDRIPGMVQQRDYGKAGELVKDLLTKFHNLPQGIVFTAQERYEEAYDSEEDEDYEGSDMRYVPDLPKGARGAANAIVDVVGRLYVVHLEGENGRIAQRRLWIGDSSRYDTGYRSDHRLPLFVKNPTVPKMVSLIRTGKLPAQRKE